MSFIPNPLEQHIFLLLGCQRPRTRKGPPAPKPGLVGVPPTAAPPPSRARPPSSGCCASCACAASRGGRASRGGCASKVGGGATGGRGAREAGAPPLGGLTLAGPNLGVLGPDSCRPDRAGAPPTGGRPWAWSPPLWSRGGRSRQRQRNGGGPVPQSVGHFVPDHSSNPGFGNTKLTKRSKKKFNFFFRKVTLQPIGIFSLNLNLSTDFLARVIIGLWPEMVSSPKRTGIICFLSTTALLPIPVFNMHLLILGLCIMLIQVSLNKIS